MRGSRSLLVLLVLAAGLGAYIYFVESKRDLADPEAKKDKVFSVETGKIEEIEVRGVSKETTTVRKTGDTWQVVAPITAEADQSVVSSLVSSLETLEMQKSLEDNPASVAPFGLEPPRMAVSFKVAGESSPRRLSLGNKTPTGSDLYARVEGQPKLFLISGYLEDTFNKSTFDFREKTVLKFARDSVDSVRLDESGSPAVTLTKKGSDWRLTAPVDARADFSAVDNILNRSSQAQMKSIAGGEKGAPTPAELKTFGLDKPQVVVTLGAGSTRAEFAIGAKKDDSTVYARDLSKPIVVTVDASLLTDLKKTASDFRVKDLFEFKSFNAVGLDLTQGGKTFSFAKTKAAGGDAAAQDVWKETKPEAKDVNQTAMTDLLNGLSAFRAEKFEDRALTSGEEIVVVARFGDETKPTEERVTFRKSGAVVHGIRAGEPGAAVVPTADFDKALTQLKELTGAK